MKANSKCQPTDWGAIWAVAWRYFLMVPVIVPLGTVLFALAVLVLIVPPMLVLKGVIMICEGSWILGSMVIVASCVVTRFIWRGASRHVNYSDYPEGL